MATDELLAAPDRQGALLAEAVQGTDLDVIVPICPEWTVVGQLAGAAWQER